MVYLSIILEVCKFGASLVAEVREGSFKQRIGKHFFTVGMKQDGSSSLIRTPFISSHFKTLQFLEKNVLTIQDLFTFI